MSCVGAVCAQDFVVDGRVSDAFALLKSFQSLGGGDAPTNMNCWLGFYFPAGHCVSQHSNRLTNASIAAFVPVIGFGISPRLAIDSGKTSTPKQLEVEILLTALCGVLSLVGYAFYAGTKIPRHIKTDKAPVNDMCSQVRAHSLM